MTCCPIDAVLTEPKGPGGGDTTAADLVYRPIPRQYIVVIAVPLLCSAGFIRPDDVRAAIARPHGSPAPMPPSFAYDSKARSRYRVLSQVM